MTRLINPLAATLLVVGIAFGFTAHAALPESSTPTDTVDPEETQNFGPPRLCLSDRCPE